MTGPRSQEREEGGRLNNPSPRRSGRGPAAMDRRTEDRPVRPIVHRPGWVAVDPRPGHEKGGYPQTGRTGPDDRRSRHADNLRDHALDDWHGPTDRPSSHAAQRYQADDGGLHRPEIARCAASRRTSAATRGPAGTCGPAQRWPRGWDRPRKCPRLCADG